MIRSVKFSSRNRVLGQRTGLQLPGLQLFGRSSTEESSVRALRPLGSSSATRASSSSPKSSGHGDKDDYFRQDRINAMVSHNFPDFVEKWNRAAFYKVGYGLAGTTAFTAAAPMLSLGPDSWIPAITMGAISAAYWKIGLSDINQSSHAIRRNYPVLGNLRYIFETIRPELRQYIVESDDDGRPYSRMHRNLIYQRAKNVNDTMSFGTRRDVYSPHHEWACHSMWPLEVDHEDEKAMRAMVGTAEYGTTQPYSASVLNISAMSYGAISDNAIMALNKGAQLGGFFHNTGEGGVSQFHLHGGGDIVWNVGTGYFGCGSGKGAQRVFEPTQFQESIEAANGRIKMVEIKVSQGAKPGHGGLLPRAKITKEIAEARKLPFPPTDDCHSPARHSAFSSPHELLSFITQLRELSNGLPIGIKLCVGEPGDIAALCKAMVESGTGPDFITVDGAEGGTGAAPPELSNSMGLPLEEGLVAVRNLLVGAGLRDKTRLAASGRVTTGFSLIRTLALGADYTCAARSFMMSLGCIQALKCGSNKCPTGIATLDKELMVGLDPTVKSHRVYNYHRKTVAAAADMVGIMGRTAFSEISGNDIMRRIQENDVRTLSEYFPEVESGILLTGQGPKRLQEVWDVCGTRNHVSTRRWIY